MQFSNRVDNALSTLFNVLKNKWSFVRNNFTQMLCILLLGFLTGNMFASIMSTIQDNFVWDGFVGVSLLICTEVVSYLTYRAHNRIFVFFVISSKELDGVFWRFANIFKIGLIFGFFVDAFKVAS